MGLANCPECGKLYLENPSGVCQDCYATLGEQEEKVMEYLREKRKATLQEIHEATGIRHKIILRMISHKRITGDFQISYPCETCGTLITEGRVCKSCTNHVLGQIKPESPKEKPSDGSRHQDRMYLGDRFQK